MGGPVSLTGPDFAQGVKAAEVPDQGSLLGHANGEPVLLVRRGAELLAVGATCSHYSGPLGDGLVVGDTIRCPWHHACFSLRTGEASGPALNAIPCYRVEHAGDRVTVGEKIPLAQLKSTASAKLAGHMVIIGAGAAGGMAVETLRREGHIGKITMLGAEATVPVDRPNLSKDFLAGTAPEEWIPLRPPEFFKEHVIDVRLNAWVTSIDPQQRTLTLDGGEVMKWDSLLLATGAEPIRLPIPGAKLPHVHALRTLADTRSILKFVAEKKRAVVIGASFIGLEAGASLRARGMEVSVVGKETLPLERVLGPELGRFIKALHEEHGVQFHLGQSPTAISEDAVTLDSNEVLPADLVVMGVGVRPRLDLAVKAGLKIERGLLVDDHLRTSAPGVWAAGDIARFPDARCGENVRIEHWAVAQRQGETAARNMLGQSVAFKAVPFFWSMHYDVQINYVGHAEKFDQVEIEGDIAKRDCALTYRLNGKRLAVATIGRDLQSLRAEAAMEQE